MKKNTLSLLLVTIIAPFLVQCASQSDINKLNYQLRVVNKKIEDMKVGTVGQMQKKQAASSSSIDELKSEILELKGQLEESAHLNRLLREQNKELDTSFQLFSEKVLLERQQELAELDSREQLKNEQLNQLNEKLAKNEENVKAIQAARIKDAQGRAQAAARAAERAKARANASSKALSKSKNSDIIFISADKQKIKSSSKSSVSTSSNSAKKQPATNTQSPKKVTNLVETADKEFSNGNFKAAYSYYDQASKKSATSDKKITALFMMGECLFYQKEYDQAILQYQKIISSNPKHARAASSLYRQGMSFEMLSDFETAKIIYKKLNMSYSNSPEASKGKERSEKLK